MRKYGFLFWLTAFLCVLMPLRAADNMFTVVIDAGHGGKDPGAKGALGNEKAINLAVALKLGALINANHKDVNVIYTRKTDVFVGLMERAEIANKHKADLFISIHTNSLPNKRKNKTIRGSETYTLGLANSEENLEVAIRENAVILEEDDYKQRYDGFDPNSAESYIIFEFLQNSNMEQSVVLASDIQKAFRASNRVNRGVNQAGFLVLKLTSMPGVLVELGFISNKEEEQYMRTSTGQNQLARSIYTAFKNYKDKYGANSRTMTASKAKYNSSSASYANVEGQIVYKVQIMASDKQLPENAPSFKGYKVDWYKDGELYKYTYGESTDRKSIQDIQRQVAKDFKGAFIIRMVDGKRLN